MEEGSKLFLEIKAGDMVEILEAMIDLAYCALGAIAIQGADVLDQPVSWQHDGHVISLMRLFSDKINHCASGSPDNYSDVYCLCVYLSRSFINADFDKPFKWFMTVKCPGWVRAANSQRKFSNQNFLKSPI